MAMPDLDIPGRGFPRTDSGIILPFANPERKKRVVVVVGAKWGDEGKAKVLDGVVAELLSAGSNLWVLRVGGGPNAGHSRVDDAGNESIYHTFVSAADYDGVVCALGADVVVNPESLVKEEDELTRSGINTKNLVIDYSAAIILRAHQLIDGIKGKAIGSTGQGIGPISADVRSRNAITADIFQKNDEEILAAIEGVLAEKRALYQFYTNGGDDEGLHIDYYRQRIPLWRERIAPRLVDVDQGLHEHLAAGGDLVLEGAQGALLDYKRGAYPFVTSTGTLPLNMMAAGGMNYLEMKNSDVRIIGVQKAFDTRVGEGPFPTELDEARAAMFRDRTEYGATTGRPRRIGNVDGVAAMYSMVIGGYTHIAITKLDALLNRGPVKIAEEYRSKDRWEKRERYPRRAEDLHNSQAMYGDEEYELRRDISKATTYNELPLAMQRYIQRIMHFYPGAELALIGNGRRTSQKISITNLWSA